jgi:hypothetical protein
VGGVRGGSMSGGGEGGEHEWGGVRGGSMSGGG